MLMLHFVDRDDSLLFTTYAGCVPQPGDTVSYVMEAKDEEKWFPDHWKAKTAISCKDWRVIKTWHHFRCLSIEGPEVHQIFVQVSPLSKVKHEQENDCPEEAYVPAPFTP